MSSFIADVYDACLYSWNLDRPTTEWYNDMRPSVRRILAFIHKAVISSWFEYTICKFFSPFLWNHLEILGKGPSIYYVINGTGWVG